MKRVLITGIAGFAGSHLSERLLKRSEVWGTHLDGNLDNITGIPGINLVQCDLLDFKKTAAAVKDIKPDAIVHLAAQSAPSVSIDNPAETLKINIFSTLNILEAAAVASPDAVILNIGSGDEYGEVSPGDIPVKEEALLKPLNPYAVSKVSADLLAFQYQRSRGLKVIRCRPFNHFGPRQSESFAAPAFAKQIAEIEAGIKTKRSINVGNLEASKDFLDVRDVVEAYELLMEKGEYGEAYNICSGRAVKIRSILDMLLSYSKEDIKIVEDAGKLRSVDNSISGDPAKLKSLGWNPRRSLEESLKDLLEFWRVKVKNKGR